MKTRVRRRRTRLEHRLLAETLATTGVQQLGGHASALDERVDEVSVPLERQCRHIEVVALWRSYSVRSQGADEVR